MNINAYHQPGVEAGKRAAEQVIAAQSQILSYLSDHVGKEFSSEALAAVLSDAASDPETVYRILMHLSANPDRRIRRNAGCCPKSIQFTMEPQIVAEAAE